jgi:hypothetical protein
LIDNESLYKIWAPNGVLWSAWAKPAMFVQKTDEQVSKFIIPKVDWVTYKYNTMIIVDQEGADSIKEGIALAQLGYRPVPLFNGVKGPNGSLIDMNELERALYWGGNILKELEIKEDAAPVFLLDSRRMFENKFVGGYDNRWCVFPQDMPSAELLLSKGIKNIIVRSHIIRDDLSHVLFRYQEKGLSVFLMDKILKPTKVRKPSRYKSLKYRFKVLLGLRRNSAGGFGGYVPDPMQYSSGTGYRGIG